MKTLAFFLLLTATALGAEPWPVVFFAAPHSSGTQTVSVSERDGPHQFLKQTDLMVLDPDGTERVLVKGEQPEKGLLAALDGCMTNDGKFVLYSHVRKYADRPNLTYCDLFQIPIGGGEPVQIMNAREEYSPPTGYFPKGALRGVWNTAPCDSGRGLVFTSDRNGYKPPSETYGPLFQLFCLHDGTLDKIGPMDLAGAMHPTITRSGRILYSSSQQQGHRMMLGNGWATFSMNPDGTDWGPEISSLGMKDEPWHFQCETSSGHIVSARYYDTRKYGRLDVAPPFVPDPFGPPTKFGNPIATKNPFIRNGANRSGGPVYDQNGFQRRGFYNLASWAGTGDYEMKNAAGEFVGMLSHPSPIPDDGIYVTHTGVLGDALMDLGIVAVRDVKQVVEHPSDLIPIVDKPDRHEWMGMAAVSFKEKYGLDAPPNPTGAKAKLPPASPYTVIKSQSFAWPEIIENPWAKPSDLRMANFKLEAAEFLRIVYFAGTTTLEGPFQKVKNSHPGGQSGINNYEGFSSAINEKTGGYEITIPLKKYRKQDGTIHYGPNPPEGATPILDPEGKPDTSFMAEIPGDQVWTFQVLNAKGEAIATAKTWHQGRCGESRECGGCHTHFGKVPFGFDESFAASPEYLIPRLDKVSFIEYFRDVKPIADRHSTEIAARIWDVAGGPKAYGSALTDIDDNPLYSDAEARTIRSWIDFGFQAQGTYFADGSLVPIESGMGALADTMPPTLTMEAFATAIYVGAHDPHSGLNKDSFKVESDPPLPHNNWTELDDGRWQWLGTVPNCTLTVSIRDNQTAKNQAGEVVSEVGNLTTLTSEVSNPEQPPPEPDPDDETIAQLQARITALEAELAALKAKATADGAMILELQGKIQRAREALQ